MLLVSYELLFSGSSAVLQQNFKSLHIEFGALSVFNCEFITEY